MSLQLYLVFVLATALLIATPGPNVALIVGTSLRHGARTGLIAMAGVNLGVMVQLVVVAAGLSWIVELFAQQFRPDPLYRCRLSAVPRGPDLVEGAEAVCRQSRCRRTCLFAGFAVGSPIRRR